MTAWEMTAVEVSQTVLAKFKGGVPVSADTTYDKTKVYFDVTGAPDEKAHRYHEGLIVRPDWAELEFSGTRFAGVNVTGLRVLKSGKVGSTRHRYWEPGQRENWPQWLQDLVAETEEEMKD
jgi:hypothetical protein